MHRLTGITRWGFLGENLLYLMSKPKAFDTWTPERQEAWKEKQKKRMRKYYEANREKILERKSNYHAANREKNVERMSKYREANREKAATDQFFIMVGAAQQISETIGKPNQKTK